MPFVALASSVIIIDVNPRRIQQCYNIPSERFLEKKSERLPRSSKPAMPSSMWDSITNIFTALTRFLSRWISNRAVSQAPQNPYPFGTREWSEFAAGQATDHELMVLRIADLEAQVQQTTELVDSLEVLAAHQETTIRDLRFQNQTLRDGPDPEIYERVWENLHKPLKRSAQPEGAEPQDPQSESSGTSAIPAVSVVGPTRPSDGGPSPSRGTATGRGTATRARPLTLAEELEGHLDNEPEDGSEDESEEGANYL